ncbi:M48 family metallopeptidase [Leptolyngbya sp. FACHB-261]|uniref:M48 family metallopeptidase n=1 Tax=Leptolyngbya sp. FACHB-261 TaxID=2692806 RepID=UPI001682E229|nr:SprT family zinc-dependent metalloprotease [Leptolyngbya sp. FACHB-261]MBD2103535.1 M48 family metallopeptidase [Leptolyngbya sp. FACHB-261]
MPASRQNPQQQITAAPNYSIRESSRAKHARLRISARSGLEVIVPVGFDHRRIPELIQQKQTWIQSAFKRLEAQCQVLASEPPAQLPETIELRAIGETWTVEYQPSSNPVLKITEQKIAEQDARRLVVSGAVTSVAGCHRALRDWLTYKAQTHLLPWLRQLSQEQNLPFSTASVRGQKTRWGSCSDRKTISVNYKLLFLPVPLVRYVFVHELCHTIHLNHSAAFWRLVHQREPDCEAIKQELRQSWRYVPSWADTRA